MQHFFTFQKSLLVFTMLCLWMGCKEAPVQLFPELEPQTSGTTALLQAISMVDTANIWVSGHQGTFGFTTDGGAAWQMAQMPQADTLQFRDLHAFDAQHVLLMAAGPGELSQIRKTADGGKTWELVYLMADSLGFLNTIEFWENGKGLALGDALEDGLFVLQTSDMGATWERVPPQNLPVPLGKEGGFAASGTCIAVQPGGKAWIGTGAGERPRVLFTADYGNSWEWFETPIISGEAAGITSIRFWDDQHGLIVGGDLTNAAGYTPNVALTSDGGKTWELAAQPLTAGAFYGSALTELGNQKWLLAVGPNGMGASADMGKTWSKLDTVNLWSVALHPSGVGLATGKGGTIRKIRFSERQ